MELSQILSRLHAIARKIARDFCETYPQNRSRMLQ